MAIADCFVSDCAHQVACSPFYVHVLAYHSDKLLLIALLQLINLPPFRYSAPDHCFVVQEIPVDNERQRTIVSE